MCESRSWLAQSKRFEKTTLPQHCDAHDIGAVARIETLHDRDQEVADRTDREPDRRADFRVRVSERDVLHDFALTLGQPFITAHQTRRRPVPAALSRCC